MNESYSIWLAQTGPAPVTQPAAPATAAPAQTTTSQGTPPPSKSESAAAPSFLPNPIFILLIAMAFMFFWMNRQQKKQREAKQKLLDSIKTGDKVVTTGGIHGVVANVKDKTIIVKIAENVKVEMNRAAVEVVDAKTGAEEPAVK
jgi:preprotein translocase subunit YajC